MQSLLIVKTTGRQKSIAASGVDAGQHGHAKQRDDGDRDEPLPAAQPATQRIFGKYRQKRPLLDRRYRRGSAVSQNVSQVVSRIASLVSRGVSQSVLQ